MFLCRKVLFSNIGIFKEAGYKNVPNILKSHIFWISWDIHLKLHVWAGAPSCCHQYLNSFYKNKTFVLFSISVRITNCTINGPLCYFSNSMQLSKEFPKWSQLDHEKTVSSFPRFVKKKRHENHFIESKIHSIQEREKTSEVSIHKKK